MKRRVFLSAAVALPAPGPDNNRRTGEYWSLHNMSYLSVGHFCVGTDHLIPIHFTEAFRQ